MFFKSYWCFADKCKQSLNWIKNKMVSNDISICIGTFEEEEEKKNILNFLRHNI